MSPAKTGVKPTAPSKGPLKVGAMAPAFSLTDQAGHRVNLSDFRGRKVLIFFYPKADTPGCTVQACSVRDARRGLASKGIAVVGISPDAPASQGKFDVKYNLHYPLLSDADHAVSSAWGTWGEKSRYGQTSMGITRSSYLVDEKGRIAGSWPGVKPEDTVGNVEALLRRG